MHAIATPSSTVHIATTRPENASSAALWGRCPSLPPRDHIMHDSARGRRQPLVCGSTSISFNFRLRSVNATDLMHWPLCLSACGGWECPCKVQPRCSRFAEGGSSLPSAPTPLDPHHSGHCRNENSALVRTIPHITAKVCKYCGLRGSPSMVTGIGLLIGSRIAAAGVQGLCFLWLCPTAEVSST